MFGIGNNNIPHALSHKLLLCLVFVAFFVHRLMSFDILKIKKIDENK